MHTLGFIYAIGAALAWGFAYTIDQKILVHTSPLVLLFISFVVGAILLLPAILMQGEGLASVLQLDTPRLSLILFSISLATIANFLILASIARLGASLASILEISYPFFVFLFSFLLLGAELNISVFIGALLIFAGSAIILRFG